MGRLVDNLELDDEVDKKLQELSDKKEKRKRRNRRTFGFIILGIVSVLIFYVYSDASKLKSIVVSGNSFYSSARIKELSGLGNESRYLFIPDFWIERTIEKDPLISNAVVSKNLKGVVVVQVEEVSLIGYFVDDDGNNKVLAKNGEILDLKSSDLLAIRSLPLLSGFDEAGLQSIAAAFSSGEEVDDEMISMISEITPHTSSYDDGMLRIVMGDGNTLYTAKQSVGKINDYLNVLSRAQVKGACFLMDDLTNVFLQLDCSSFSE